MRTSPGVYNNHGYVQLRLWPEGKAINPKPYTEGGFGCWCEQHIKDAEKRLRIIRQEIDEGKFIKSQRLRELLFIDGLDIHVDKHYRNNPERSRGLGAVRCAEGYARKFKKFDGWNRLKIHEVKPVHVQEYMTTRYAAGATPATVRKELGILGSVFETFYRWTKLGAFNPPYRLPEFNPVEPIKKPGKKEMPARERVATREELKNIKSWCLVNDQSMWKLICEAMMSFLRKDDLLKMQAGESTGFAGKTGKRIVMPVTFGQPSKLINFRSRWERLRIGCNLTDFHWHDWRHTGATLARQAGIGLDLIQEALQHSKLEQTLDYVNERAERLKVIPDTIQRELEAL